MNLSAAVWWVLGLSGLATVSLAIYVKLSIPREMRNRYQDSFRAFSRAVELRFPHLNGQTDQVQRLCRMIGLRLGLAPSRIELMESAAMLRDLGLCAIPYRLLNHKSPDEWTPAEREQFLAHPEIGAAMLELIPSLHAVAPIIRLHDGSCETAPVEARILCVVNTYVRTRAEHGPDFALRELRASASEYDPRIVDTLASMLLSTRAAVEFEPHAVHRNR